MYYTYVLRSKKDKKIYIGWTSNLKGRFEKHNKGLVRSTKGRIPFKLVYYEACLSKQKAIKREKYLKSGYGRSFLKKRI
ncbi:GIY-YIG nuclease family protein [Patescibacteria group bacterium]